MKLLDKFTYLFCFGIFACGFIAGFYTSICKIDHPDIAIQEDCGFTNERYQRSIAGEQILVPTPTQGDHDSYHDYINRITYEDLPAPEIHDDDYLIREGDPELWLHDNPDNPFDHHTGKRENCSRCNP